MNLKLPLKTESVDAWNGVYLFDGNDIQIGRIYNRETAEELVSSVNSCPAMRDALDKILPIVALYEGHCRKMAEDSRDTGHLVNMGFWQLRTKEVIEIADLARSALFSAPVDQQKERMVSILKRLAALPDTPSPMLIKGRIENLIEEAAALLKEMEANHG
jgi:hypothetical protein